MNNKVCLKKLGKYVSLRQGLAINAATSHLVSDKCDEQFHLPLLRIADMIDNSYSKFISKDVPKSVKASCDDIIYTRTGQIGLVFTNKTGVVHNNSFIVNIVSDELDKKYLYTVLQSPFVRNQALALAKNSVQPDLTHDMFRSIVIPIPHIDEQIKIANILSCFDKKILMNKAINDNLEQMALTMYMHYFFERTPNGKLGSVIVEHQKSNIQVGEAEDANGNVPFFTSGDSVLKWNNALVDGRCCYLNTGGNADVKFYVGKAAYSTDTWCISGKDQLSDYLFLLLNAIKPEIDKKFFQGTGLKHLQKPLLKDRPIYIPTTDELSAFNAQIMPMMTKISENTIENQQLIQLRDWLLPMLMNGQATVAD